MKIKKSGGFIPHRCGAGFSLIELMVVISIIAVLSVVGIVVYTNVLKNSRDSKRLADLKFIQSALEDYHADQLFYPLNLNILTNYNGKVYLNQIPTDPLPSQSYLYSSTGCGPGAAIYYCLTAQLEGTNLPVSDPNCTAVPPINYCVTRP